MTKNTVDIRPRSIPIIETTADLVEATRTLAQCRGVYILGLSMHQETGDVTLSRQHQIAKVAYGLNLASQYWKTFAQGREIMVLKGGSRVRSEVYDPTLQSSTDFVVGHHVISGLVRPTFMTPTEAYMTDRDTADERLSELLAMGQTDPTLVDPDNILQGEVSEGQMLVYRPMEGEAGLPLAYCFDVPVVGHVEQLTMFALRGEAR